MHPWEGSFYEGLFVKRFWALFIFICTDTLSHAATLYLHALMASTGTLTSDLTSPVSGRLSLWAFLRNNWRKIAAPALSIAVSVSGHRPWWSPCSPAGSCPSFARWERRRPTAAPTLGRDKPVRAVISGARRGSPWALLARTWRGDLATIRRLIRPRSVLARWPVGWGIEACTSNHLLSVPVEMQTGHPILLTPAASC